MKLLSGFPRFAVTAALAVLTGTALAQPAPQAARVPAAWSDVDLTLSYERLVASAQRGDDPAPLKKAQQQLAAEGTPTHARLMMRLSELSLDKAAAFKMGPCQYAAVLVRGMLLRAYEDHQGGQRVMRFEPTEDQADQFVEQMNRCELMSRRTPTTRLIGQ